MTGRFGYGAVAMLVAGYFLAIGGPGFALAQPTPADEGLRVFKSANCMGCHKWTGSGGGGYGGASANLRQTMLTLDQIEQTIRCGRPSTGMPHFDADAYSDGRCYGLKKSDLGAGEMPPEPDHSLRPADIGAVAAYVVTHLKDRGDPTLAECQAFFGTGSRVCGVYANQDAGSSQPASASTASIASHDSLKVDAATDTGTNRNSAGK